jgi:tryptophan synthase beta subunit
MTTIQTTSIAKQTDKVGYFGNYGGQLVPPQLKPALDEVAAVYEEAKQDPSFIKEYQDLLTHYVGRPSPLYFAKNLTKN